MPFSLSRRALLTGGASAALANSAAAQNAPSRPNILLIITDQQTHTALSSAGNRWVRTPNIDALAANGTRFEQAICTYPVCSPSRSSIFTSRMPHETGVRTNGVGIASGIPTLGEVFRDGGYETVYGGKWHLPKPFEGMTGFTRLIGGNPLGARMDEPLATACAAWLRNAPHGPFLLVASFMNPHDICYWIRDHKGTRQYADPDLFPPVPGNMGVDPGEPEDIRYHRTAGYDLMSQAVGIAAAWKPHDVQNYLDGYYRLVENVDAQIGRVLAALRESDLERDTLVAFIADHGEGTGAHRWVQKASFYEESVRVPFLLAGPGIPKGAVNRHDLVSLLDLMPTLCDYAGLSLPAGMHGTSLRGALNGEPLERDYAISEVRYGSGSREGRMVRSRRYKYISFNSGSFPEQLFDLQEDPGETVNVARDASSRQVLDQHRAFLKGWGQRTQDDFVPARQEA